MVSPRLNRVLPEWEPFAEALRQRRPDTGTWCEGWTVHDVLVHQTGNAEELHRVLAAHRAGIPVATRAFEERESAYRTMSGTGLWAAFTDRCEELAELAETHGLDPATEIAWTGRTVTPAFFAEHLRQELVLHRWDMTGDDDIATHALSRPWITRHSVREVGKPLLVRGSAAVEAPFEGRLRTPGTDDILVTVTKDSTAITFAEPEGEATIESDPAARVLFLWGRRPNDSSRWHSQAGPEALVALRTALSGY